MLVAEVKTVAAPATQSSKDASLAWQANLEAVQPFLAAVSRRLADQVQEFEPEIATQARHALTAQGKQLRPMLVALSASACGGVNDAHVSVATIIEMIHLATLVHDDVIDQAEIRRGRPTMSSQWGNEISVLLGDCLFAHALKLASGFPTTEVCRAVSAATNTVCTGEILQIQQRRNLQLTRPAYFRVLAMKTGELFGVSCYLGGVATPASVLIRDNLRQYGLALGTAYQIFDDCLDLFGSEASAGKTLGTDMASGKVTLPLLVLNELAEPAEKARLSQWLTTWNPDSLPDLVHMLRKYKALDESRRVIHEFLAAARRSMQALPPSEGRRGLMELTEFLGQQTDIMGVS